MRITVKLFANLKDIAKKDSLELQMDEGGNIGDLIPKIIAELPALKEILETRRLFISINQEMAVNEDILKEGDEIGLLPPFSGG